MLLDLQHVPESFTGHIEREGAVTRTLCVFWRGGQELVDEE